MIIYVAAIDDNVEDVQCTAAAADDDDDNNVKDMQYIDASYDVFQ